MVNRDLTNGSLFVVGKRNLRLSLKVLLASFVIISVAEFKTLLLEFRQILEDRKVLSEVTVTRH